MKLRPGDSIDDAISSLFLVDTSFVFAFNRSFDSEKKIIGCSSIKFPWLLVRGGYIPFEGRE